jgi:hypothetical protein
MLYDKKMPSLRDKIQANTETIAAVAEVVEEKVKPKAKKLKVIKVGNKKKLKK